MKDGTTDDADGNSRFSFKLGKITKNEYLDVYEWAYLSLLECADNYRNRFMLPPFTDLAFFDEPTYVLLYCLDQTNFSNCLPLFTKKIIAAKC